MQIIDFHTHIYPESIAAKASASVCDFYNLEKSFIGTSEILLEQGKKAEISGYVLLPVANSPENVHHINQFIVREKNLHEEFYGFGTLHAAMDDFQSELDYIEGSGLLGIKIHPDSQKFNIDDKRMFPIYDSIQGRLPILIHCGDKRFDYSHPRRLLNIISNFPRLQIIAAHLGGWSIFEEAFELLKDKDCYVDMSSCMSFMAPEQMVKYIKGYGADRVLFGSDFPIWDPSKEAEAFLKLGLNYQEQEKIAFRNAQSILNKKGS